MKKKIILLHVSGIHGGTSDDRLPSSRDPREIQGFISQEAASMHMGVHPVVTCSPLF